MVHGDGTTTVAKKGGDNIGFSGHKHIKGDKVVTFCDRNCNVIAPFVAAPGNRNESPLLREALPQLTCIARAVGLDLRGSIVSLDGVYDSKANRKAIFNRGMIPNINENPRGRKTTKRGPRRMFSDAIFKGFHALTDEISRLLFLQSLRASFARRSQPSDREEPMSQSKPFALYQS